MKEKINIFKITNLNNPQETVYRKKVLKIYNSNLSDLTIRNTKLFLEIKDNKIYKFESDFYFLGKKPKIRIFKTKENFTSIKSLKKHILKKDYFLIFFLISLVINFKYLVILLTDLSIEIVIYLNDTPIGIKQNVILKNYFTKFFLVIFNLQLFLMKYMPSFTPIKLLLLHLIIIHNVITKIYYVTFRTICDCFNIFRGRNYNRLKNRTDKINYTPDVIVLASFVFVFSLLIMYTIFGFFLFSLFFRLIFIFFYFICYIFIIFFTTNFSKKGIFRKIKKKYKLKKLNLSDKIKFALKMSLIINKINHNFISEMFSKDYQLSLLN